MYLGMTEIDLVPPTGKIGDTTHNSSVTNEEEKEQSEYYNGKCGIYKCSPKWLQILNNPKMFLFSISCFVVLAGLVATGFISVGISSIERRYNLSSTLVAFAVISYELGVILTLPFSSYFGGRSHKPRVLGISLLILGIGCLVFASPHYFSGAYNFNSTSSAEICTNTSMFQPFCGSPLVYFYPLFVIGNMIIGCGSSTIFTVGIGFIDDSTHPRYSSIYLSVFQMVGILGPALGFVFGGFFLSLFVDPFTPTTLTNTDPQWVGAWWIGFVITGVLSIILSLQFFLYPRRLKGSEEYDKLRKEQQPTQNQGISFQDDHDISIVTLIKEYPFYVFRILKNLTFLFVTIGITVGAFVVGGVIAFMPKYIEIQLSVTPSIASYLIGGISIPAASIGIFLGGLTLFFFKKISVEKLALMVLLLSLLEVFTPPVLLITCAFPRIAGVNVNYPNSTTRTNIAIRDLNISCFSSCDCRSNFFQPICSEGVTYFSPCVAGCPEQANPNGTYAECSCLSNESLALDGKCTNFCTVTIIVISVLLFIGILLLFYNNVPFLKLTLRCVADKDRTVALGIQSLIVRIFGQVPGPLVLGGIFDLNCILWQETECGTRGACLEYNTESLRYSFVGFLLFGVAFNNIFFLFAWISWKYRKIPEDNENTAGKD